VADGPAGARLDGAAGLCEVAADRLLALGGRLPASPDRHAAQPPPQARLPVGAEEEALAAGGGHLGHAGLADLGVLEEPQLLRHPGRGAEERSPERGLLAEEVPLSSRSRGWSKAS